MGCKVTHEHTHRYVHINAEIVVRRFVFVSHRCMMASFARTSGRTSNALYFTPGQKDSTAYGCTRCNSVRRTNYRTCSDMRTKTRS